MVKSSIPNKSIQFPVAFCNPIPGEDCHQVNGYITYFHTLYSIVNQRNSAIF